MDRYTDAPGGREPALKDHKLLYGSKVFSILALAKKTMAKTDYQTIDEYHLAWPEATRERLQAIRELIHTVAPGAEEVISYQVPAFKVGKQFLIYYSAYPKHLSLSSPWSRAFLDHFAAGLEGLKVSKAAIQFPHAQPLPLNLIKKMIVFRKKELG